jgi:hypothetical protein
MHMVYTGDNGNLSSVLGDWNSPTEEITAANTPGERGSS